MDFSQEKFDAQVARLERVAARSPRAYKARVVALGALGYLYLLTALGLLVGLLALLGVLAAHGKGLGAVVKLGIPLLVLVAAVGRALWVRLPPPEGRELPRGPETAALWAEVDAVQRALRGPRIHRLLLTSELNAAIVQLPLFGLLGPSRNHLILGLPLMQALSLEHFRAVLAHEFGHLSGSHGAMGAWVYRVRRTWSQVRESLESREGWGAALFTRFFNWYAPFYAAYSFVLARTNEYEADRASADVVGAQAAAGALVAFRVRAGLMDERYWSTLRERAGREQELARPYSELPALLNAPLEPAHAQRWLDESLADSTGTADTHPCLSDRLAALGQEPRLPGPLGQSAAEALFGEHLAAHVAALDAEWRAGAAESWAERYAHVQEGERRIAELRARTQPLSSSELFELARKVEEFRADEDALPLYQQVWAMDRDYTAARFNEGRLLLSRGDERGLAVLEEVIERDIHAVTMGCGLAVDFLGERGRLDEARGYAERGQRWADEVLEEAKAERDAVRQSDTFLPHGLEDAARLERLREQVQAHPRVRCAWLARKKVVHLPASPVYVLGVDLGPAQAEGEHGKLTAGLVEALDLPGSAFVVPLNEKNTKLFEGLRAGAGAPFFEREASAAAARAS
jgi:Zn-dependent protease with chaperone function